MRICMGVSAADRVFVMTDRQTRPVGDALAEEADRAGSATKLVELDAYRTRPLASLPEALRADLVDFAPTVTFYAAAAVRGEIAFRIQLIPFLWRDLKVRHGHMPGVEARLLAEGLTADYRQVAGVTLDVFDKAVKAGTIVVTSPLGTSLRATFDRRLKWKPCTGLYHRQGEWGNLPEGEVFTSPADVSGVFVAEVLGDYFSERYGVLQAPVTFHIAGSRVTRVLCADRQLAEEVSSHLHSVENGDRVGEFAIGTNIGLESLTGNLLQDEKIPGVHIAFGNPYPEETGAGWSSKIHVDVISTRCDILLDGQLLMRAGKYAGVPSAGR